MTNNSLLTRIYRLKLVLSGVLLVTLGLLTSILGDWLDAQHAAHFVVALVRGLSDVLMVTGAIGIAIDFFTGRDKEAADTERTRQVLKDLTPDFADAVIKGFRVHKQDLARVASPELLDEIATNVLSLRLGDDQFAQEIYADIRDQAIKTPERWYDVRVNVRLSSIEERNTSGVPRFNALVEWEYTTTPSHAVARFACVSDRDEFHELLADVPATWAWFMTPKPGLDASAPEAFELLEYSVDGESRHISRRASGKSGQIYSAAIGDEVVHAGLPVRIRHTFRTVVDPANHRLFLTIAQPARDIALEVDYSATDISRMTVSDLVPSSRRPYVSQLPADAAGKELAIEVSGWVQAGTGFTFVWTLAREESARSGHTRQQLAKRAS